MIRGRFLSVGSYGGLIVRAKELGALVISEIVTRDPDTHEVESVDHSGLAVLLIEAVKSQEAEIRQL